MFNTEYRGARLAWYYLCSLVWHPTQYWIVGWLWGRKSLTSCFNNWSTVPTVWSVLALLWPLQSDIVHFTVTPAAIRHCLLYCDHEIKKLFTLLWPLHSDIVYFAVTMELRNCSLYCDPCNQTLFTLLWPWN